mgnify:CR=1 FL=1
MFVRNSDNFIKVLPILRDNNLIKEVPFKNSVMTSFRLKTVVDHIVVLLDENPYFLVENS